MFLKNIEAVVVRPELGLPRPGNDVSGCDGPVALLHLGVFVPEHGGGLVGEAGDFSRGCLQGVGLDQFAVSGDHRLDLISLRSFENLEVNSSVEIRSCWPCALVQLQKLIQGMDFIALADLQGIAPAGIPHHLPSPDCRGPVGVALWLPHQDGVSPEGGHAVLYE